MPQIFHGVTNFGWKFLQLKHRIVALCHKMLGKTGIFTEEAPLVRG
jgi:hypothetical protein